MALREQPYLPLYVMDFLTDEKLTECSAESTGVYIRLMCIMHKMDDYGVIELKAKEKQHESSICNFACKLVRQMPYDTACIERSLTELIEEGVLTLDGDRLYQKRMVRDGELSKKRAESGSKRVKNTTASAPAENVGEQTCEQNTQQNSSKTPSKTPSKVSSKTRAKYPANAENEIEIENEIDTENDTEAEAVSENADKAIININYKNTAFQEERDIGSDMSPQSTEEPCPYAKIMALYHDICVSYPRIRLIDGKRRTAVAARWRCYKSLGVFEQAFRIAESSSFLKGDNKNNWCADFDWMMKATNFAKILEHKYDGKPPTQGSGGISRVFATLQRLHEEAEYDDKAGSS